MKNTRFFFGICLFSCLTTTIFGQTEQGKLLIGGETKLDFSSRNEKSESNGNQVNDGKTTNIELFPKIGFFVIDRLALGIEMPLNIIIIKNGVGDKTNSTSLTLAPFVRYYFGKRHIKPYLNSEIGFGKIIIKQDPVLGSSNDFSGSLFSYEIGSGVGIFLNEKVCLDIGLVYSFSSIKFDQLNNSKTISNGIESRIGFIIIF